MSRDVREELYSESGGSPYIGKVLLGQMAQPGTRTTRPKRLVARRADILDALFARTFAGAPVEAQRMFLALSQCLEVLLVALEAVLTRPEAPNVDVELGLEFLLNGALVEIDESAGSDDAYIRAPTTAAAFGRRRLKVSPLRAVVEGDVALLRMFGPRSRQRAVSEQFERFARLGAEQIRNQSAPLDRYLTILESAARARPSLWLLVADLHDSFGRGWSAADQTAEALRNYLETYADDGEAWRRLAATYGRAGDVFAQVSALVERAELPDTSFGDVSYAASRILAALAEGEDENYGHAARDWLIQRIVVVMESRSGEASATDCSRLAWLHLHQSNEDQARYWVGEGLRREPANYHCSRLKERLAKSARVERHPAPYEHEASANTLATVRSGNSRRGSWAQRGSDVGL